MKLNTTKHSSLVTFLCLMLSAPILCAETQIEQDQKASMATWKKTQSIMVPKVDFKQTPLKEALAFLQEQSRLHDPEKKGVTITLEDNHVADKPITLKLTNTPLSTVLQHVASASKCSITGDKNGPIFKDDEAAMAIREKLKTIIVPKVEFKQTPLKEALTITLKQARELDPEMKEVNFIVADAELADKPITLTLTKVPVEIVLHYLLDISRAAFRVEKNNVVFRPFKVNGKILQP